MSPDDGTTPAQLRVTAEVVARLGAELITDRYQALLELIKNSYDAEASRVGITIETTALYEQAGGTYYTWKAVEPPLVEADASRGADAEDDADQADEEAQRPEPLQGSIEVIDDGYGMDDTAITEGWLTLSTSPKRAAKDAVQDSPSRTQAKHRSTIRARTPLGDKGLGRLGAQRLGDVLIARSRPRLRKADGTLTDRAADSEFRVALRFSDFTADKSLDEVRIFRDVLPVSEVQEPWPGRSPWGTTLRIVGMHDFEWNAADVIGSLSSLLNPFVRVPGFEVRTAIDGQPANPVRITQQLRAAANHSWKIKYDGARLLIEGKVKRAWFRPQAAADRERFDELLDADGTMGLLEQIRQQPKASAYEVSLGERPWLVTFRREVPLPPGALPGRDRETGEPVPCGPFSGEIEGFTLQLRNVDESARKAFSSEKQYRNLLEDFARISVYRDGFRVTTAEDILELGKAFTTAASYYYMRPGNVLGFIAITAEQNSQLEETTNREKFRRTPAYEQFEAVLEEIRDQINGALNAAGRGMLGFLRQARRVDAQLDDEEATPVEATAALANRALALATPLRKATVKLEEAASGPEMRPALDTLHEAEGLLGEVGRVSALAQVLQDEIESMQERLDETYALVGLALIAESLAHELTQIIDRLERRVRSVRREVDRHPELPQNIRLFVEEVADATRAVRAQLRHIDPQLRYARSRARVFDLTGLIQEVMAYHAERLADARIEVEVQAAAPQPLRAVPGHIIQVLDNLTLNAEHWLRDAIDRKKITRGRILVTADGPTITFADNGPGIREDLRTSLFDPFVSSRKGGRGLGLYISRQLLERDGATIELVAQNGTGGAQFRIDLTRMVPPAEGY